MKKIFNRFQVIPTGFSFAIAAFFLICGYELVRSPSNSLFKAYYGSDHLPYAMAMMPIAVWLLLYIYGKTLSYLGARKTLIATSLGSALIIVICSILLQAKIAIVSAFLIIFKEAYIMILVEQYWSFLNSTLSIEEARKWNGPIIGISSLGAILGGVLVNTLAKSIGTANIPFLAALSIIPATFCANLGFRKYGEPKPKPHEQEKHTDTLGLKNFLHSPLFVCLFVIVIASQIVSTVLDLHFQNVLQIAIPSLDEQTAYSGKFFATLNIFAAALQFIGAPLLLRFIALPIIFAFIPALHFINSLILTVHPSLAAAAFALMVFKSIDYSIFRASKETLYIPFSFAVRYRTKEVIDVFGYRFSKGATSFALALLQKMGFVIGGFYPWIGMGASLLWLSAIYPLFHSLKRKDTR